LTFDYHRDEDGETVDSSFTPYPDYGLACDTITCDVWGHSVTEEA